MLGLGLSLYENETEYFLMPKWNRRAGLALMTLFFAGWPIWFLGKVYVEGGVGGLAALAALAIVSFISGILMGGFILMEWAWRNK